MILKWRSHPNDEVTVEGTYIMDSLVADAPSLYTEMDTDVARTADLVASVAVAAVAGRLVVTANRPRRRDRWAGVPVWFSPSHDRFRSSGICGVDCSAYLWSISIRGTRGRSPGRMQER